MASWASSEQAVSSEFIVKNSCFQGGLVLNVEGKFFHKHFLWLQSLQHMQIILNVGNVDRDDLLKVCREKEIEAVRQALIKSTIH